MGAPYLEEMWESDAAKKHVNKLGGHFQLWVPHISKEMWESNFLNQPRQVQRAITHRPASVGRTQCPVLPS